MIEETPRGELPAHFLGQVVRTDEIPAGGLSGRLEAGAQENAGIADALDLVGLHSLIFSFRILPSGKNRYTLSGTLQAAFTQRCVITLEPLEANVEEDVELEFMPREELARLEEAAGDEAANLELDGPEPVDNGLIGVGQLAYEIVASNVDPYPRKTGASFDWAGSDANASAQEDSPFAVLQTLDPEKS